MEAAEKLRLSGHDVRWLGDARGAHFGGLSARPGKETALVAFVATRRELDRFEAAIVESALADRLTWVVYPKGGQMGTDLNRDILWKSLLERGIRPVTNVSIDATWTALRFRPTALVRSRV